MISSENGLLLATVLLNVQGRDVGGFVDEARARVAQQVSLPAGYYVAWSGRWENQEHARQRLQQIIRRCAISGEQLEHGEVRVRTSIVWK